MAFKEGGHEVQWTPDSYTQTHPDWADWCRLQEELALQLWGPEDGRRVGVLGYLKQESSAETWLCVRSHGWVFMTYTEKNPDVHLG